MGDRVRAEISQNFLRDIPIAVRRQLGPAAIRIGEHIVENAVEIAKAELVNNRPESRRNKFSTRWKPHLVDSYKVGAPDLSGGRVRIVIYNSSPAAGWIEDGTGSHRIHGPGAYPFVTSKWGGGQYANPSGVRVKYGGKLPEVDHPGTRPYKILERARKIEQAKPHRIKLAVRAALKG